MTASRLFRPDWPAASCVRAACTLRNGGVSLAPFSSLNLAAHVGDEPSAVLTNRSLIRDQLRLPSEPLWLSQVHGARVLDADAMAQGGEIATPAQADAAVTHLTGRVLAVMVADCLPVLMTRADGSAVAVAHAGWRGIAAGVLEATVAALGGPPAQPLAWLGPAISQAHFEVGAEVREVFCEHDARAADAFVPNARGRWQCDLYRLARQRLAAAGVAAVHGEVRCTYQQVQSFYSYRRDGRTGRMAALIWIVSKQVSNEWA